MRARLSPGRVRGVRLSDVPLGLRQRKVEVLLRHEDNAVRRYELLMAANRPSDRVYFLPAAAVEDVLGAP